MEKNDLSAVDKRSQNMLKRTSRDNLMNVPCFFNNTVFENHGKSHIQHCERSEQIVHLDKSSLKMPKIVNFGDF